MRKLLSVVFVGLCVSANARQITSDEAISVVSEFFNSSYLQAAQSANSALRPMKAPGMDANSVTNPFYIFNRGENDGFVIISGDDRAPKILGYSDKGSFDAENLPPQLKGMMEVWAKQMNSLPNIGQHASWKKASATRAGEGVLLKTAEWGQGYPYNIYCPIIEGEQAPAGCVATAMAIAMKYHNWPQQTQGGIQEDFNYPEFTLDFSDYSIDWSILEDEKSTKFADEIGQLIYSTGVAAQMLYGQWESSAEMWPLGHKMRELYAFDKDCQYIEKAKFDESEWTDLLIDQLHKVGPVIYRGSGSIGHAFVIDGYDGDSLFHVNWGWDGLLNGYFTLSLSDVGGSSFNEDQGMIINIKPDKERKEYSKSFVPNCDVYISSANDGGGWNFMSSNINTGEMVRFKAPSLTLNGHVGYFDIAIVDKDDNILQLLGMGHHNNDPDRHCTYPGMTLEYSLVFPGLKEGERYQMVSMEADLAEDGIGFAVPRSENPNDWRLILGGLVYPSYFYDKGNRSEVSQLRFHVDESMPCYFAGNNTFDHELILHRPKGGDGPENIVVPKKGVKLEVKAQDNDGTIKEALYVGDMDEYSENLMCMNVSLYADQFDVYISYDFDGDTRKDANLTSDQIIEEDGLIYKIDGNSLCLIGYDKVSESVTIPNSINVDGIDLNVRSIGAEALMFAPIKDITIKAKELTVGQLAFAGMEELEKLTVDNIWLYHSVYESVPFVKSGLKRVYLNDIPDATAIFDVITGWHYHNERMSVALEDVDFILTSLPQSILSECFSSIEQFSYSAPENEMSAAIGRYIIPGIGEENFKNLSDHLSFNISQMWNYEIDKSGKRVRFSNLMDDVEINSVSINGKEAKNTGDGIYKIESEAATRTISASDVSIDVAYTIDGNSKICTYTPELNNSIGYSDIVRVDGIFSAEQGFDIYTPEGYIVKKGADSESLKQLTPGIYLIREGKEVKKIVIR